MHFSVETLSEDALLLRFGNRIDAAINARVNAAARALRAAALPGVVDIAPAFASLLLRFEAAGMAPGKTSLIDALHAIIEQNEDQEEIVPDTISIPVCYGGDFGPDLAAVAAHTGLSLDATIARHAAGDYSVAMLGFAPGFPYLLGLDPALHMPRRADPRTRVPAGSVAIGGAQTGIYPRELPGGWQLIGRTPLALFDPTREPPAALAPGTRVRFRAIDRDEFAALAGTTA
jgi:KipI family sensor histidine kinase inhibitor